MNGGLGETIANGMADSLKARLMAGSGSGQPATPPRPKDGPPHFLVAYAGQGGRQIQELSKADLSTDLRTPENRRHGGGYYRTSLDDARRAMAQAAALGKKFDILALCWMQGEANGGPTGGIKPTRWDDEIPRVQGLEWYRDQLIAYRKQWSDDLRGITGQKNEIPMFTYQTLGPAGEAQLMATDKDPHIHMVGTHYAMASAINSRRPGGIYGDPIHLSADAERWLGQQFGKVIFEVTHRNAEWTPLRPTKATVEPSRASVLVEFHVPHPPLVLDETFLPRQENVMNGGYASLHGFQLRDDKGVAYPITKLEVEGATRVRMHFANPLPAGGKYAINYGHPNAGELGAIAAFRQGPSVEGQPTMEMILEGDLSKRLKSLTDEGVFFVTNTLTGRAVTRVPIRKVRYESGDTFLQFETRELRNGVAFNAGQTVVAQRPFTYGNLRDSDDSSAMTAQVFGDEGYGTRAGQPYPLWNWCVLFSGFPVEE
ncbi:phosphate ABC transporter substrate-binding protein [Roseimicrobium sp. ORNL1]|nr:phosphate ABC transporter substrate-binding protein [Roseimicrobium sp. ORNL1]